MFCNIENFKNIIIIENMMLWKGLDLPKNFKKTKIKEKNPLISVIIPTYNEEEDIEECIKSVLKQNYKKIEIIVIDDSSSDRTVDKVKKFKEVRLFIQKHKGPGEARNLGAEKAKGEILILIDADMVLFPDYVERLTKPLIENKALGTIESIQYNMFKSKMQECCGKYVRLKELEGENSLVTRAITKQDFIDLGGFDRRYGYADDKTFYFKYGIKFLILKDVKCYHKTPQTWRGVYMHSGWIGSSTSLRWINVPVANLFYILFLYLFSPLIIPALSIRQVYKIKKPGLLFPYMLVFMAARYFGTLRGYLRRIFFKINVR